MNLLKPSVLLYTAGARNYRKPGQAEGAEMKSREIPFIIKDSDGEILALEYTNEKGYKKSIENQKIWVFHSETGRLLPYSGPGKTAEVLSFKDRTGWCEAVLRFHSGEVPDLAAHLHRKSLFKPSKKENVPLREKLGMAEEDIIQTLADLIKERHIQLPKGSYTTHLFESGGEKIRKKMGEEAIELLLASERKDIIYEAADLIYHLLVFLKFEDIEWREILEELRKR